MPKHRNWIIKLQGGPQDGRMLYEPPLSGVGGRLHVPYKVGSEYRRACYQYTWISKKLRQAAARYEA